MGDAMARRSYTPAQKTEALQLYATDGPTAVQHQLGIAKSTVVSWARANGIRTVRNETNAAAIETIQIDAAARRAAVLDRLWRIADEASALELTKLAKANLRDIVGARTRAIHDAQLLAGDPTGRTETVHTDQLDREIERLLDTNAA